MVSRTYNEMLQKLENILEERTASVTIQSAVDMHTDYLATITTVDETRGLNILASGTSSTGLADCLNSLLDEVDDIYGS